MGMEQTQAESSDEEWNALKNIKTLKGKMCSQLGDKFRMQLVGVEDGKEDEDSYEDEVDSDDEFYAKPPEFGD